MKELVIDVCGGYKTRPIVTVDGERIEYEKIDSRYKARFCTDKDRVTVTLTRVMEINCRFWFPLYMLYFFLSIFGIFDVYPDKKHIAYNISFEVELKWQKNEVSIKMLPQRKSGAACSVKCNSPVKIVNNEFYVDSNARKRAIILTLVKLAIWIVGIALLITFIFFY